MKHDVITLATQLINIPSITPNDHGCQLILIDYLKKLGFEITVLNSHNISNFLAIKKTKHPHAKCFAFSGHTDVVPPGDKAEWASDPFEAVIREGKLFGRGAADMKTAIAAMIIAIDNFLQKNPDHPFDIAFLITSDEEGDAVDGTAKIVEFMQKNGLKIDYCLIGEASSNKVLGDSIKVGRRGSLHGELIVHGKQGHIAYPHLAINPIHRSFQALDALTHIEWDKGNALFSPTTFQIYNIHADTGANNVIPGSLTARFNFRHNPDSTADYLQSRVESALRDHQLEFSIKWNHSSKPFYSQPGILTQACISAITECCHVTATPNTTGGTSDGRFIAPMGTEVVELGLCSNSIHQVNEHAPLEDIEKLVTVYSTILEKIKAAV